jgi:hypothetical protein
MRVDHVVPDLVVDVLGLASDLDVFELFSGVGDGVLLVLIATSCHVCR